MVYDVVQRHIAIEKLVTRMGLEGLERKYYRVRPARWYGGIVTADCVGCGLLCKFCWASSKIMLHPADFGRFYTPSEIVRGLIAVARKRGLKLLRISGGEPTLGKLHLLKVFENLQGKGYRFILETNGIPIASDENYSKDLSRFDFIHARVSLKGCNEKEFAALTGAKPENYVLQLKGLKKLFEAGVSCHPSVMTSFSSKTSIEKLAQRITQISPVLTENLEIEELILYPHVARRLKKCRLKYYTAYAPDRVPEERV